MKKISIFLILLISLIFIYLNLSKNYEYKVLNVYSADTICVDFNLNSKCDYNEKVKLYAVYAFPEKFGNQTKSIEAKYKINEANSVVLGLLAKKYTANTILNRYVTFKDISDDVDENYKVGKIYLNGEDFSQTILKEGWALTDNSDYKIYENLSKVKKNIANSKKFNYQLRNKKNNKIHTLDCEYGRMSKDYEIGIFDDEKYKKDYCHVCHKEKKESIKKQNFDYSSTNLKIYFLDFSAILKPNKNCSTNACKVLLENINKAQKSIDFAIFGLGDVPEIEKALINAKNRGVKIRLVVDEDAKHKNLYSKTNNLKKELKDYKTDYDENETIKYNNFIMHDKYFIFDDMAVWSGSANISETDLSGFNANNVIFVKSKQVAQAYKTDFERMYNGEFHTKKKISQIFSFTQNNSPLKIAFSPNDDIITSLIIPYVKNSKNSIKIETFIFTHKPLADELINAKNKGVDVKIIVDATSASSNYSMVKKLRDNGISVKVENYAGKMHMKTVTIDGKYFISGSMNLTKSGEKYNDENIIFIENTDIASHSEKFFDYIWAKIPDIYLKQNISAESKYSIGSCSDGIDNDYNGKTDKNDSKCH